MHKCKCPGCGIVIVDSLLMCPVHWARVPRPIQLKVYKAWKALSLALRTPINLGWKPMRVAKARDEHDLACDEAIESLNVKVRA